MHVRAFFQTTNVCFLPVQGHCLLFFTVFLIWIMNYDGFPKLQIAERENLKNPNAAKVIWRLQAWERQICHDMRTQKDTRIHPCHIWPKCHCMLKAPTWNFIFLWFFLSSNTCAWGYENIAETYLTKPPWECEGKERGDEESNNVSFCHNFRFNLGPWLSQHDDCHFHSYSSLGGGNIL